MRKSEFQLRDWGTAWVEELLRQFVNTTPSTTLFSGKKKNRTSNFRWGDSRRAWALTKFESEKLSRLYKNTNERAYNLLVWCELIKAFYLKNHNQKESIRTKTQFPYRVLTFDWKTVIIVRFKDFRQLVFF